MRRIVTTLIAAVALAATLTAPARAQDSTTPEAVVRRFYEAFGKGDFATMEQLYAPDVHWQDTIFSYDGRANVMGVWRFEIDPSKGGKITSQIVSSSGDQVVVRWSDDYSFFGNPVKHDITATLTVKDGRIVDHVEDYSWDEWAKQAFAFKDLDLGGFAETAPGKAILETALRAFVYTYVPLANAYASVAAIVGELKDKLSGDSRDAAPAPVAQPPRTGISELLQRRMGEAAGETRGVGEGR